MSAEMVGIIGVWLTVLALFLNLSQGMRDFRKEIASEINGFQAEVFAEINGFRTKMLSETARLNEHLARVEGLLQGYIERPQTEKMAATE